VVREDQPCGDTIDPGGAAEAHVANCRCFSHCSVTSNLYLALMAAFGTRLYGQNPSSARGRRRAPPTSTASATSGTMNLRVVRIYPQMRDGANRLEPVPGRRGLGRFSTLFARWQGWSSRAAAVRRWRNLSRLPHALRLPCQAERHGCAPAAPGTSPRPFRPIRRSPPPRELRVRVRLDHVNRPSCPSGVDARVPVQVERPVPRVFAVCWNLRGNAVRQDRCVGHDPCFFWYFVLHLTRSVARCHVRSGIWANDISQTGKARRRSLPMTPRRAPGRR